MDSKKYGESLAEIEVLLKNIEDPDKKLEDIKADLERGLKLIEFCKKELADYSSEINAVLEQQVEQ